MHGSVRGGRRAENARRHLRGVGRDPRPARPGPGARSRTRTTSWTASSTKTTSSRTSGRSRARTPARSGYRTAPRYLPPEKRVEMEGMELGGSARREDRPRQPLLRLHVRLWFSSTSSPGMPAHGCARRWTTGRRAVRDGPPPPSARKARRVGRQDRAEHAPRDRVRRRSHLPRASKDMAARIAAGKLDES